jgi:diamine N-acetyltransferase
MHFGSAANRSMVMIQIRKAELTDWRWIYQWENFESLWEVTEHPGPFTSDEIIQFLTQQNDLKKHKQERWLIQLYQEPIGMIDLFEWKKKQQSIGIGIAIPDMQFRRRGYAKESLQKAIAILQDDWNIKTVHCNIQDNNQGSLSLFVNLGFQIIRQKRWNGHIVHELSLSL